jgi:ubiquinone biosynthesis protein
MMLFAFLIESFVKKTKRLKLVEVVFLLKEITNLEMDLRFEAAAANEYAENTKMMLVLECLKSFGILRAKT